MYIEKVKKPRSGSAYLQLERLHAMTKVTIFVCH